MPILYMLSEKDSALHRLWCNNESRTWTKRYSNGDKAELGTGDAPSG